VWPAVPIPACCAVGYTAALAVNAAFGTLVTTQWQHRAFPCTHPSTASTGLDRLQAAFFNSNPRYDATGKQAQLNNLPGGCSPNRLASPAH